MADRTINISLTSTANVGAAEKALRTLIDAEAKLLAVSKERARLEQLSGRRAGNTSAVVAARKQESAAIMEARSATLALVAAEKAEITTQQQQAASMRQRQLAMLQASMALQASTEATRRNSQALRDNIAAAAAQRAAGRAQAQSQMYLNNVVGSGNIALMSFTQGIQDASQFGMGWQQGMRAITNNIQSMTTALTYAAVQAGSFRLAMKAMGAAIAGPFGILLGISAVTSAIDFMANRSVMAKAKVEKLKDALSDLVDISNKVDGIVVPQKVLEGALQFSKDRVESLREEIRLLREGESIPGLKTFPGGTSGVGGQSILDPGQKAKLAELTKELEAAERRIESFGKKIEMSNERIEEMAALARIPDIDAFGAKFDTFSAAVRRVNSDTEVTQQQFAELYGSGGQNALDQYIAKLEKKGVADKVELTILQKLRLETIDLASATVEWRTDGALIAAEEAHIARLEEELRVLQEIARLTEKGIDVDRMMALGSPSRMTNTELGGAISKAGAGRIAPTGGLRGPGKVPSLDDIMYAGFADPEWARRFDEQLKESARATEQFSQSIDDSMTSAAMSFSSSIGEMIAGTSDYANVGQLALGTLGDMAVAVGKIAMQTGFAALAIGKALRTALTSPAGPIIAIAAGAALVALGKAVGGSLKSVGSGHAATASGGGSSIGAAPGILMGTSGNIHNFVSQPRNMFGFTPASGLGATASGMNRIEVVGTMRAEGRELVTVIRNETETQKRQGISNPLGT